MINMWKKSPRNAILGHSSKCLRRKVRHFALPEPPPSAWRGVWTPLSPLQKPTLTECAACPPPKQMVRRRPVIFGPWETSLGKGWGATGTKRGSGAGAGAPGGATGRGTGHGGVGVLLRPRPSTVLGLARIGLVGKRGQRDWGEVIFMGFRRVFGFTTESAALQLVYITQKIFVFDVYHIKFPCVSYVYHQKFNRKLGEKSILYTEKRKTTAVPGCIANPEAKAWYRPPPRPPPPSTK